MKRPIPNQGGFSLPYRELLANVQRFYVWLDAAAATDSVVLSSETDAAAFRRGVAELMDRQMLSRAVQVFAGMTAESALNTYGLIRFGEATFERCFARRGPVWRLTEMAKHGAGRVLAKGDPLVCTLESLCEKRNRLVHPRAEEAAFDRSMTLVPASTPQAHRYLTEADAAYREVHAFLRAFADLDSETQTFLWPLTQG